VGPKLVTFRLSYVGLPKMPSLYTFNLKMATAMSAELLNVSQHSTGFFPESRIYTLN
jgi:hypothetical protein